jgi:heme/copper-type cytochrome/quinol oxidase subunit 4
MLPDFTKLIFPHLPRDQRRRAMSEVMLTVFTAGIVALVVAAAILWMNRKR